MYLMGSAHYPFWDSLWVCHKVVMLGLVLLLTRRAPVGLLRVREAGAA